MLDKEAILALRQSEEIDSANNAILQSIGQRGLLALPTSFNLHDIEKNLEFRLRSRGKMVTTCIDDFAAYTKDQTDSDSGCTVFVSDDIKATAVLNLGTPDHPGHADNLAVLDLQPSAAYKALLKMDGTPVSQKLAVEFCEDWLDNITFCEGSGTISKGQALNALRTVTIEAARKIESVSGNLSETMSAFEKIEASTAGGAFPDLLMFSCVPFEGLASRIFAARISVLTGSEKPQLVLRVQRLQSHIEEMSAELVNKVRTALAGSTAITVTRGTYTRAN